MNELTLVLFVITLTLFVVGLIVRKNPIYWLAFFVSVCSIGQTITDYSLTETELVLLIIPAFYVLLMSGWSAFSNGTN